MENKKVRIYKAKDDVDVDQFGLNGWELMPPSLGFKIYKDVKLRKNSAAVKAIHQAYNYYAPTFCHGKMVEYLRGLGITFMEKKDKKTGIKMPQLSDSDACWDALKSWRVEITFDDYGWIRMCPLDFRFPNPLYPADILDKYPPVKKIIDEELARGTIEEFWAEEQMEEEKPKETSDA